MASIRSLVQQTTGGQDRPISNPAGAADGDLFLMFGSLSPATGSVATNLVFPAGWTTLASTDDGVSMDFVAWHRFAASDAAISIHDVGTVRQLAVALYAVKDAGTPVIGALASLFNNAPNSPAVTIPGQVGNHLFFSFAGITDGGGGITITAFPANYNNNTANPPVVNCTVAVGTRPLAAATDDPGAFAMTQTNAWIAWTVGVPDSVGSGFAGEPGGGIW